MHLNGSNYFALYTLDISRDIKTLFINRIQPSLLLALKVLTYIKLTFQTHVTSCRRVGQSTRATDTFVPCATAHITKIR